ncbi:MAG TPA: hypothetical protein VE135_00270 [Pyrinomonadaceae bacterium]|nr:hypothetical protein [Pyrinomonadaceae bacterium]
MNKLKPALLGGLIAGILSAIPYVNTCCCIWAAVGGLLATFLYIRSSPVPVSTGEGAVVGVLSGVVGSIIYVVIGLPLALLMGTAAQAEETFRRSGIAVPVTGIALVIMGAFMVAVLLLVFSAIGGLIAVPIFGKGKGTVAPPPPPQNLGGPGGFGSGL